VSTDKGPVISHPQVFHWFHELKGKKSRREEREIEFIIEKKGHLLPSGMFAKVELIPL
jgi:hypothetical protein